MQLKILYTSFIIDFIQCFFGFATFGGVDGGVKGLFPINLNLSSSVLSSNFISWIKFINKLYRFII